MRITKQKVTSLIVMGRMPLNYFSNVKNRNAKNKHDTEGGI
jgi:hypothetical protein